MSDYGNFKRQIIAPLKTGQEKIYNYTKKDKKTHKHTKNKKIYNYITPLYKNAWDEKEFLFWIKNDKNDKFIILYSQEVSGVQIEIEENKKEQKYTIIIIQEDYNIAKMIYDDIISMHTTDFKENINFKELIEINTDTKINEKILLNINKRIEEIRKNMENKKPIKDYITLTGGAEVYAWAEKKL